VCWLWLFIAPQVVNWFKKEKTRKKDHGPPKRPPSAYRLYCVETRPLVRAEVAGLEGMAGPAVHQALSRELRRRWGGAQAGCQGYKCSECHEQLS
jgi:hypothetical protein